MTDRDALFQIFERFCPMVLMVDETGHIRRAGPTLRKLRPDRNLVGMRFLELFEITRPRSVTCLQGLLDAAGTKLHLQFRDSPKTTLKGVIAPLPDGAGAMINLSFGISILDAVRDYALSSTDFSPADLTIELLYLVEAKSAAMEASRQLNQRLQGAKIAAEEQAYTDTLTGLKNRRALDHVLERTLGRGAPFVLMHLDLDFFKAVNDTMGHAAGDHVLQQAARIMVEITRDTDTVARVGGDEFVILLNGVSSEKRCAAIADRLIARIEEPVTFGEHICCISASIGIAFSAGADKSMASQLLHQGDLALYAAKRAGRGRHCIFHEGLVGSLDGGDCGSPSEE